MTSEVHYFLRGETMHPDVSMYMWQIVRTPEDGEAYPNGAGYGMPHSEFERYHTLIQWMFPTMEASACQPHSPVLSWEDVKRIQVDEAARFNLLRGQQYMRRFYSGEVGKPLLLSHRDHNHLRITRVIESLSLLHSPELAQEFTGFVCHHNATAGYPVNMESVEYWNKARYYGARKRAENK